MIGLKRVYDQAGAGDGRRFLVERLWPRGVSKTSLKVDSWLKEVAPSNALRRSRRVAVGAVAISPLPR